MPCYSRITTTQILDDKVLLEVLLALKIKILSSTKNMIQTSIGTYARNTNGSAFSFEGENIAEMKKVNLAYAKAKSKAIMKRAGYSVMGEDLLEDGNTRIKFLNRGV